MEGHEQNQTIAKSTMKTEIGKKHCEIYCCFCAFCLIFYDLDLDENLLSRGYVSADRRDSAPVETVFSQESDLILLNNKSISKQQAEKTNLGHFKSDQMKTNHQESILKQINDSKIDESETNKTQSENFSCVLALPIPQFFCFVFVNR